MTIFLYKNRAVSHTSRISDVPNPSPVRAFPHCCGCVMTVFKVAHCNWRAGPVRIQFKCLIRLPILTCMCLWAIYIFPGSVCLFCCRKICGPMLGRYINHSQIHKCRNYERGRTVLLKLCTQRSSTYIWCRGWWSCSPCLQQRCWQCRCRGPGGPPPPAAPPASGCPSAGPPSRSQLGTCPEDGHIGS